jgi:hypothetical protein
MPGPVREEAEILMMLSLATRRARAFAFDYPGAAGDRMDELADKLSQLQE